MPKVSDGLLLLLLLIALMIVGGHGTGSGQAHTPAGACPPGWHDAGGSCVHP
jgi:hypothetical protein